MANKTSINLNDLDFAALRQLVGDRSYSKGILAVHGTNAENVKTTAAVDFSVGGVMYTKAATAEFDLSALGVLNEQGEVLAAVTAQAAGKTCNYLLVLNSAGTCGIIQSEAVTNGATCKCPGTPPTYAPFAAVKVVNGTASAFTFGTTSLGTSGLTVTYVDLAVAPATL